MVSAQPPGRFKRHRRPLFAAGLKWFLLQSFAGSPQLRYLSLVDAFVLLAVVAVLVATQE